MKGLLVLGGSTLAVVGFVGVLHLPVARPALAWFAKAAGCPVSLDGSDAVTLEKHRLRVARSRAGARPAGSRAVLGFVLGESSRVDVSSALSRNGATCEAQSHDAVLRCRMPDGAHGELDAHLQFDALERLVAIDLWHPAESSGAAVDRLAKRSDSVERAVGPRTAEQGVADPTHLQAKPLRRIAREYAYSDYLARLSVMNLGKHGVRLREQHQWVPPRA